MTVNSEDTSNNTRMAWTETTRTVCGYCCCCSERLARYPTSITRDTSTYVINHEDSNTSLGAHEVDVWEERPEARKMIEETGVMDESGAEGVGGLMVAAGHLLLCSLL